MMRRLNVYTVYLVCGFSALVTITIGSEYVNNAYYLSSKKSPKTIKLDIQNENGKENHMNPIPILVNDYIGTDINNTHANRTDNKDLHRNALNETFRSTVINKIVEKARNDVKNELSNYHDDANNLEHLLMESGGQPFRTLIISQWRSGSTFLGNMLNTIPSTYYHYEPLLVYGHQQIRELEEATEALKMVKQMFQCNFYGLEHYFEFESKKLERFSHNTRLFDYCKGEYDNELCFDAEFSSRLCKLFPFQTMKLVRLRLRVVEEILKDQELNVKVILLVRDPRGLLNSRQHAKFCKRSSDCWEPPLVCADLVSDYMIAGQIMQKYPDRLMVIRFEDLALKPNKTADEILKFLKLDVSEVIHEFLQSHTTIEVAGFHSTVKVSSSIPFKWKTALDYSYVKDIQMACKDAMDLWGYKMAQNETHMKSEDFNPIEDYTL